jgi:hypothetical protein
MGFHFFKKLSTKLPHLSDLVTSILWLPKQASNLSAQKTALNDQRSEIEDYIANVPPAKTARLLIEKGIQNP